jgi:hypothetical protein
VWSWGLLTFQDTREPSFFKPLLRADPRVLPQPPVTSEVFVSREKRQSLTLHIAVAEYLALSTVSATSGHIEAGPDGSSAFRCGRLGALPWHIRSSRVADALIEAEYLYKHRHTKPFSLPQYSGLLDRDAGIYLYDPPHSRWTHAEEVRIDPAFLHDLFTSLERLCVEPLDEIKPHFAHEMQTWHARRNAALREVSTDGDLIFTPYCREREATFRASRHAYRQCIYQQVRRVGTGSFG